MSDAVDEDLYRRTEALLEPGDIRLNGVIVRTDLTGEEEPTLHQATLDVGGVIAEATGVDLPAPLRDLAERAARALDVSWLGVDLLVPGGDGPDALDIERAVVNETNARPTVDAATKYESGFYDRLAALVERTAER